MKNFFHMLREDVRELARPEKPFCLIDYIVILAAVAGAFFVFDTASMIQTASAGVGYLNLHFSDFYEYARGCGITELFYMPIMYITYAVWNIPVRLVGLVRLPSAAVSYPVLLWYKLLTVIVYFVCAYVVYKLAMELEMGRKKAKLCVLAAFTMPVGFFLQFSYGQVMGFPLLFLLVGLFFYLKGSRWSYIACFAAAAAYEQYVWLLILPLILLKEKRLRQLSEDILLVALPSLLEYLLYSRSAVFRQSVQLFNMNKSSPAGLDIGVFVLQYVVFFWILILGWAYFTHTKTKKELSGYALFFVGLAGAVTLCLSDWKAEYFMFLVPFSVLSAFLHRDLKIFMILDIGWAGLLAAYVMIQRLGLKGINMEASLFTVLVLVIAVFKHPKFLAGKTDEIGSDCMGWLRVRFLAGAMLCTLPALAGFIFA